MMKQIFTVALAFMSMVALAAKPAKVTSPSGQVVFSLSLDKTLSYSLAYKGKPVVTESPISLSLASGKVLGARPSIDKQVERSINTIAKGNFYRKATVPNVCTETEFFFKDNYQLVVRAYDNGVAYRWVTREKGRIKVMAEQFSLSLFNTSRAFVSYAAKKDLFCSFENPYDTVIVAKIDTSKAITTPMLAVSEGVKVLVTESDLHDYPGLNLVADKANAGRLSGLFAPVVTSIKGVANGKPDYDMTRPTGRATHLAETDGDRHFPWRVIGLTDNDAELADFDLVYLLARQSQIEDLSWIKPGKAAWDWWNGWNIWGVDFKVGKNTATYKYFIDFAAANKLPYIVMDEGWSTSLATVMEMVPEIDLKELVSYADKKGVGIILWATGYAIDQQMKEAFGKYSAMGIKGFKIDFMDRDDQYMVNFYERTLKEAATYKLMIDFHGAFKPTGLNRTWPNEVSREGIYGNEQNKWSKLLSPYQQTLYPFIRFAAGHADFTPGAMRNATARDFRSNFNKPMSQGSRCHQLAMYVLYDSPIQMLADAPRHYQQEADALDYLREVPTTWDETRVLSAELGKHLIVAKRKAEKWYIAGMSAAAASATLPMNWLPRGQWDVKTYADGLNVDINAEDYKLTQTTTNNKESLKVSMAEGGGVVMVLTPQ